MGRYRFVRFTRIVIAVCVMILMVYFGRDRLPAKKIAVWLGKIAVNTFCPASLYEKHLYYLDGSKKAAAVVFGNVFPIVNFLCIKEDDFIDNDTRQDIELIIGQNDISIKTSAPVTAVVAPDGKADKEQENNSGDKAQADVAQGEVGGQSDGNVGNSDGQYAQNGEGGDDEKTDITDNVGNAVVKDSVVGKDDVVGTNNTESKDNTGNTDNADNTDKKELYQETSLVSALAYGIPYALLTNYNYVHDSFYIIPSHTALNEDMLRPAEFLEMNLAVTDKKPCILLYHTHSQEAFKDSTGSNMTIVQAGDYLEKILTEQYGFEVIHVTTQFDMKDGWVDRGTAYSYAEEEIGTMLRENPNIDMVIDLHRDGVNENLHFVTEIDGKQTAKVMLFNGISYSKEQGNIDYIYNPYLKENLALTYQIYALGKTYYPDFFRCIYIEAYRYNLHLCRRSMLIEAGAQTNTFEEVLNAMEPLAELIARELSGEKPY